MSEPTATVYITKLAAAERQLRAAIRLFFADEDELAVHTIAAAAYGVLKDLKADRGRDEAADTYLAGFLYLVQHYRDGTLPADIVDEPGVIEFARELDKKLPADVPLTLTSLRASVSPDVAKKFWAKRNKVSNFLKHADRDVRSHISNSEIDNFELLVLAMGAYVILTGRYLGTEGLAFSLFCSAKAGTKAGLSPQFKLLSEKLETLSPAEQLRFCSAFIQDRRDK